jgi:hypothetical protein
LIPQWRSKIGNRIELVNLNRNSSISIETRQSQSKLVNLNRNSSISIVNPQSKNPQSPFRNPQSSASRVHFEVRVLLECPYRNECRLAIHAEAFFGTAIGANRPHGFDQPLQILAPRAGA